MCDDMFELFDLLLNIICYGNKLADKWPKTRNKISPNLFSVFEMHFSTFYPGQY